MKKLATWTIVAVIGAAFGFGGVPAVAHSPAGYCASHPTHPHCVEEPPDTGYFPNIGDFLGPFVALGTCNTTLNECELAKVGDYCEFDSDCQGEVNGKAAINSYGQFIVETIGLKAGMDYDVCLAGIDLESGDEIQYSLTDNAGPADGSGKFTAGGNIYGLDGKTIIQPSIQIISNLSVKCGVPADTNIFNGPIVQETGLTFIPF